MSPKTVGLIAHTGKPGAGELVRQLREAFELAGVRVVVEKATAALTGNPSDLSISAVGAAADLLIVIGGDGTILNAVSNLQDEIKPIFGINIGSLGFLTCLNSLTYRQAVESILSGNYSLSDRALLAVQVRKGGRVLHESVALNDAVISRGKISRLVRLRTRVNGEALTEFNADGLIVATPTGSTAYSLSAGGPILAPQSGVFVITPICPHVLTNRSVIVEDSSLIEIEASRAEIPVYLSVDGRDPITLELETTVAIRRSEKVLPLAVLPESSFFSVLRQKLKWSGSNV